MVQGVGNLTLNSGRWVLMAAFICSLAAQAPASDKQGDRLGQELAVLVKNSHTESFKRYVEAQAGFFRERFEDPFARRQVIFFYCDIKAKGILAALLENERTRSEASVFCLRVFAAEDIPRLYEIAAGTRIPVVGRPANATGFIDKLCLRTVEIVGLPRGTAGPTAYEPEVMRTWWVQVLRTARAKGSYESPLVTALKYFEKAAPDREPAAKEGKPTSAPVNEVDRLERELNALVKGLSSDDLSMVVRTKAKDLKSDDPLHRWPAVYFFCDIKAKGVLSAVLESRRSRDDATESCLRIFGVEDIPRLYELAEAAALKLPSATVEESGKRQGFVHLTARRTIELLSLPGDYPRPKVYEAAALRAWWAEALRTARAKGTYRSPLDVALKQLEKPGKEQP